MHEIRRLDHRSRIEFTDPNHDKIDVIVYRDGEMMMDDPTNGRAVLLSREDVKVLLQEYLRVINS